jgi:hypothetical protein
MKQEDIIEGNKLIAEFMQVAPEVEYCVAQDDLKYHKSWDALIPVCKKIIGMYFDNRQDIFAGLTECNIEKTHTAVIEFIKFWNDPTQPKIKFKKKPIPNL